MKLSAPPPPPPEPEPNPEPNGEQNPAATENVTPQPAANPAPEPRPATWPGWYGGMDAALVVLAVAVVFLAASFTARNSDLWVHLGAGKLLTTGEYRLGTDPFSYTAADRTWVNHSWLLDLVSYQLYRADTTGFALVFAKAVGVAGAFVLLLGIRRAGQPLWPWALLVVVAAIASAPRFTLSPTVASVFFLALTLFLVFRVPSPPGSWRLPLAVGITFWFWANADAWFFLGPVAIGLLLIGELVRGKLAKGEAATDPGEAVIGRLPTTATLTRALLVGIVACMLNPHHVRVWELPFELVGSAHGDPQLQLILASPLRGEFWQRTYLGSNANGIAYAALLVAGLWAAFLSGAAGRVLGSPFDVDPLPLPLAVLWVGFAVLSLLTAHAIPFLAVVTVPLVASRLNVFSNRVSLGNRGDRRSRVVLLGSGLGRMLSLVAFLGLCVAAWPGWLHQDQDDPAATRRVAWAVEPDPALVQAAGQFKAWRDGGELPADVHGISTSVDLANYCAWYAPGEKVYLDGRFAHHRPELPDFVTIRSALKLFPQAEPPEPRVAREVMDRRGAQYVALATTPADSPDIRERVQRSVRDLMLAWQRCAMWFLDGRAAVFGWRPVAADTPSPVFDRLRVDPVRLAFGPDVEPVPPGKAEPAAPLRKWIDEFLTPARSAGPEADEAFAWEEYKRVLTRRRGVKSELAQRLRFLLLRNVPQLTPLPIPADALVPNPDEKIASTIQAEWNAPWPDPGALQALPILAVRAARRAIAANPDHPDGYFALAQALADLQLPLSPSEREIGRLTALHQCLSRMPPPDSYRRGVYASSPTQAALELYRLYLNPLPNGINQGVPVDLPGIREIAGEVLVARGKNLQRVPLALVQSGRLPPGVQVLDLPPSVLPLDLAQQALALATRYAERESEHQLAEQREAMRKGLGEEQKRVDGMLKQATDQFRQAAERGQLKPRDRYQLMRQLGLVGGAIAMVKDMKEGEAAKEFGAETPQVYLQVVALELAIGRLPDAASDITSLKDEFGKLAGQSGEAGQQAQVFRALLRPLEAHKLMLEGDYKAAGDELEQAEGRVVGAPLPPEILKFDPKPFARFAPVILLASMLGATDGPFAVYGSQVLSQYPIQQFGEYRNIIANHLNREAGFFFRRGFLSLLEGDNAAAKMRFQQSRRTPPPGWGLSEFMPQQAAVYLQLFEQAEKKAVKP